MSELYIWSVNLFSLVFAFLTFMMLGMYFDTYDDVYLGLAGINVILIATLLSISMSLKQKQNEAQDKE